MIVPTKAAILTSMVNLAIPTSVRALFPKSAGNISVTFAWRRSDSTLEQPSGYGSDGWTAANGLATRAYLEQLQDAGFSYVALHPSRTAGDRSPVAIASLL